LGVKVLDKSGSGYLSDVVDGIYWAVDNGAEVINMSLGASSGTQTMLDAVNFAYNHGVIVIAAAGNSGDGNGATNDVNYPAKYASVMAVAATDILDNTPSWSSEGAEVEIAAPGVSIRSTWNNGDYNTISGTSMAAPHVAGAAALIRSAHPGWTVAQIRSSLTTTADDLGTAGFDYFFGHGLVDAEESVTGIQTNP
jgi:subtilisin family serine protease